MKRTLSALLLICLILTLFSCKNDSTPVSDNRSAVFRGEAISALSSEASQPNEFPACHGGKVLDQVSLDNGTILQEEILTENASLTHWCSILSASGELLFSVMPAVDLGYDLSGDNAMSGDIFRLTDAVSFGDDQYIFSSPAGIISYSSSGELQWMTYKSTAVDMLCFDDSILLLTEESGVQSLYLLDSRDGVLSEAIALSGEIGAFTELGGMDILFIGADSLLYAGNISGLYQLSFTDENAADITLIASWMQSRISPNEIRTLDVIDSQTFEIELESPSEETKFMRYTMIPADEVPEVQDVTLAQFSILRDYQLTVYEYNQQNTDSQIVIQDYTVYEPDQRNLLFNAELAAGNVPDMVIMEQYSSRDTTISTYERADIFTDLTPLLQADADINYDGLLSYVTEPFKLDGKQYLFPLYLNLRCNFGSPELFDGPVTVDEYLDICERENRKALSGMYLFGAALDDHYDEKTAVCTFNDGTLAAQMNRADSLQENENPEPLVNLHMSYPTLYYYAKALTEAEMGDELIPVGVPNAKRELFMDEPQAEVFAITEASTHKEAAVDFLQTLIKQNTARFPLDASTQADLPYTIPLGMTFYKDDIYDQLALFEGKTIKISGAFTFVYDPIEGPSGMAADSDGYTMQITRELADEFCEFLDSITRRVNNASPVQDIFWDEFWAMQDRPAEVVLDYIQSKASIYLAETMD